jgi:hypothetical protein
MTQTRHCLALLLLAAGCAPVETWHKPGETAAGRAADLTACRVAAVQSVPANTQIGRTPVRVTPPRQRCVRAGDRVQCLTTPGQVYGGQSYSYDANAGLRADVVTQCMATRGYRAVRLPACRGAAAEGPIRDSGMPALTEASCAVKTRGGAVIVTPS